MAWYRDTEGEVSSMFHLAFSYAFCLRQMSGGIALRVLPGKIDGTRGSRWRRSWTSPWRICESRWGMGGPNPGRTLNTFRRVWRWRSHDSPRSRASPHRDQLVDAKVAPPEKNWRNYKIWIWNQRPNFVVSNNWVIKKLLKVLNWCQFWH